MQNNRRILGLMAGLLMAFPAAAIAEAKPLTVAYSDGITSAVPFFVAQQQGFFKEAGLEVNGLMMGGSGAAMAAAIKAGDIDIALGGAAQYMGFIANGAVDGKLIGELTDNNYAILGADGITSVDQLRGKKFGISSHNAADHVYSIAVLSRFGIKPEEIEWIPLGNAPARLSALMTDNVQGIEITITSLPESEADRIISSPDESPVPFVGSGVFATSAMIEGRRADLRLFLDSVGKGADWIRAHPEEAVKICLDSGADEARCKDTIRVGVTSKNPYMWPSDSRLNIAAIEGMIPEVILAAPKGKGMTIENFVDSELAKGRN